MDYDGYWSYNPYYGANYGYGGATANYAYDDPDGWWFRRNRFFPSILPILPIFLYLTRYSGIHILHPSLCIPC